MVDEIRTSVNPERLDKYYFPINLNQVKDLLGKMLTHVEAMNLREGVEKANKDLVRQHIWKWFAEVQENSLTSYKGCIAPIFSFSDNGEIVKDGPQSNRWNKLCPNCGDGTSSKCSECPPSDAELSRPIK
jgi:hypothetical protein